MLKRVHVNDPVKSLECGHGAMDDNFCRRSTLTRHQDISYILATSEAAPGDTKDTFTLKTIGTLSIAGKENTVTMDVVATRGADGAMKATGVVPIEMTDFGVKPPTATFRSPQDGRRCEGKFRAHG